MSSTPLNPRMLVDYLFWLRRNLNAGMTTCGSRRCSLTNSAFISLDPPLIGGGGVLTSLIKEELECWDDHLRIQEVELDKQRVHLPGSTTDWGGGVLTSLIKEELECWDDHLRIQEVELDKQRVHLPVIVLLRVLATHNSVHPQSGPPRLHYVG